jgi:hypothetical protein
MAKLILSFEGTVLKTVALNKERITLGRKQHNDIQVDNLAVSGEHAVVTTILNDSVIEDLNSTNGTLVNGALVQKHLLRANDVIELGKHKLKYVVDAPAAATYPDFEKTMVIRKPAAAAPASVASAAPGPNPISVQPRAPQPVPPPAAMAQTPPQNREGALQILSGPGVGRVLDLTKSLTTLGKAGVQVVVFTRRPVGFFVTHVEGEFPLFNGEPLGAQARQLADNDTIELGGIKMSFFYKS